VSRWRFKTISKLFRSPFASAALGALLLLLTAAGAAFAVPTLELRQPKYRAPQLLISSPPHMAKQVELLEGLDPRPYAEISELLDLEDPGPPIRVLIVPEGAEETKLAPAWAVAYALSEIDLIVLMPSRVPAYPDGDITEVLRHEVAHILISRAAGRRPVPRFFNEGLAVVAARGWQLQDRSRLLLAAWPLAGKDLPALREDFDGGATQAGQAYVVSAAFVRYLLEEEGGDAAARILRRLAEGKSFDAAFLSAIGHPLEQVQAEFWDEINIWQKWVPLLTGSTGISLVFTGLSLLAWRRRREKDRQQRRLWELEEEEARNRVIQLALERELHEAQELRREDRTPSGHWIN